MAPIAARLAVLEEQVVNHMPPSTPPPIVPSPVITTILIIEESPEVIPGLTPPSAVAAEQEAWFLLVERFFGHVIIRKGIVVDSMKVEVVLDWEPQKTVLEIRSFLGLTGYYRKFIHDFLKMATSLTCLTKKGVPFIWGTECQEAFETLKAKLNTMLILTIPSNDKTFVVYIDASLVGLGGTLMQTQRVVAYI
ncbi:uncharacterized protein LOC109841635 [Asparagus officinalis]|uniref:uncharacterized protein LOC109841635 n=1 Tax=Asparagus officinalis TaxID=4686 RepID=UPI00098E1E9B|nr:uncharacterized protein LOC109841635 [Asparagus officinalis]